MTALREYRVPVALFLRKELLDCGENYSPGGHLQLRPQVGATLRLDGRPPQQVTAARKGPEELVVEVVAVGENDDRGV